MENGFNKFTVMVSDAERRMENLKGRVSKIQKNVDSSLITHGNHLGLFVALNNGIVALFSSAGSIPRFGVYFAVSFVTLILSVIGVAALPFFYGYSKIRLIRYGIRDLLIEIRNLKSEIHYLRNRYEMYRVAVNYFVVSQEFRIEVEDLGSRVYRLIDFGAGYGKDDELQILLAADRLNTKIIKICRIIALCAVIYTVAFVGVLLCTGMNNHRPPTPPADNYTLAPPPADNYTLAPPPPADNYTLAPPPPADNYTLALRKALMFFNAQRSGKLPKHNNVTWRGNSCLNDGKSDKSSISKNLVGGYYDAGDASKFNFPASFAMTMLSWSVVEYSAKYDAAGELTHVKEIIKWGTDFFLKTFNSSADTIDRVVAQVGVGDTSGGPSPNDHYCWMRPEDIDYPRPVTECHNCSDLAAEMAAALASASIVFKDNKAYSQKLVHGAKTLFKFARDQRGIYSMGSEAAIFYNSTSYWDEFLWAGAWMYYATGNNSYLSLATNIKMATHAGAFWGGPDYGVLSWDNKLAGAQVLLTRLRLFLSPRNPYEEALKTFHNQTSIFMCSFLPNFTSFNRTKGGLIQLNHGRPQPLQYVVNAAFLATVYSDYLDAADTPGWYCGPNFYLTKTMRKFAESQIDYILGKNPIKMSYLVGFGNHYPKHVHHRGASIPTNKVKYSCKGGWKWRDTLKPNPNTIVGAMVAGPDRHDGFHDVRTNYNYTEPTLAGNAGLVAALVALSGEPKARQIDKNTMFSAVPPMFFTVPPAPFG